MAITQLKNEFSGLFRISELDLKNWKCKIEKMALLGTLTIVLH